MNASTLFGAERAQRQIFVLIDEMLDRLPVDDDFPGLCL